MKRSAPVSGSISQLVLLAPRVPRPKVPYRPVSTCPKPSMVMGISSAWPLPFQSLSLNRRSSSVNSSSVRGSSAPKASSTFWLMNSLGVQLDGDAVTT